MYYTQPGKKCRQNDIKLKMKRVLRLSNDVSECMNE